jgi:purine nucleoside phosphorylase
MFRSTMMRGVVSCLTSVLARPATAPALVARASVRPLAAAAASASHPAAAHAQPHHRRRHFTTAPTPHTHHVEGCVANDAAAFIRAALPKNWQPHVGLILGSGMGAVADAIEVEVTLDYGDIPRFPVSTVVGHKGRLILGKLNGLNVACFQGRVHLYEGIEPSALRVPIYALKLLGCEQLFVTTAVGSLMPGGVQPGDLVAISDHINLQARSPLIGPNDPIGPRFVDMGNAYDADLRDMLKHLARENNIRLYEVGRRARSMHVGGCTRCMAATAA